tara:strand:+ start:59139 stop:60536 length:1398 start_codon:yes stop_codon:yes gene_type:complete
VFFKNPHTRLFIFIFLFGALAACKKDDDSGIVADDDGSIVTDDLPPASFTGEIEWSKTFGGSREDEAISMVETADGGYAIVGYTLSNDGDIVDKTSTDADFWLLKLNTEGELLWSKTYGGSLDDRATKLINTSDGGFAIIGFTRSNDGDVSNNNGFYDYWLLKLDTSGTMMWEKTYGFNGNDQGQSVVQTQDGGYFLTGFLDFEGRQAIQQTETGRSGNRHGVGEFWGIKTDASGNEQWNQYYGGTNNDRSYDVVQTEDGGFIMVGNTESDDFDITNPKGSYDFWAVRIDDQGNLLWQKNYGGSSIEIAYAISKTNDGNYLITGDTRSSDQDVSNHKGNADAWLIKINDSGDLLWQKTFGGAEFDTGRSISEMPNGNLLLFGSSRSADQDVSTNYGQSDFWLVITGPTGNIIFEKNYGGSALDFGNSSLLSSTGNIILAGSTESTDFDVSNNQGSKDVLVIKLKN